MIKMSQKDDLKGAIDFKKFHRLVRKNVGTLTRLAILFNAIALESMGFPCKNNVGCYRDFHLFFNSL